MAQFGGFSTTNIWFCDYLTNGSPSARRSIACRLNPELAQVAFLNDHKHVPINRKEHLYRLPLFKKKQGFDSTTVARTVSFSSYTARHMYLFCFFILKKYQERVFTLGIQTMLVFLFCFGRIKIKNQMTEKGKCKCK